MLIYLGELVINDIINTGAVPLPGELYQFFGEKRLMTQLVTE